ncbi:serine acetyltransferase [Bacteroidia bacterium]|nr:serine acetyltransferase [Bacteroidia bacterium]
MSQSVIQQLIDVQRQHGMAIHPCLGTNMLSYSNVKTFIKLCREVLFPGYFGDPLRPDHDLEQYLSIRLGKIKPLLADLSLAAFCFNCKDNSISNCINKPKSISIGEEFLGALPAINQLLLSDVAAIEKIDPAAKSADEIIFSYPGLRATISHRIAHQLTLQQVPLVPRMISEMASSDTGIDIHPATPIGKRFAIDHGTGTVIGGNAIIGDNVTIYQGVTLGAKSFDTDATGKALDVPRHPIIEDDVTIYAGAKVMGRITIGRGSIIGGNVWLTESVPPYSKILRTDMM